MQGCPNPRPGGPAPDLAQAGRPGLVETTAKRRRCGTTLLALDIPKRLRRAESETNKAVRNPRPGGPAPDLAQAGRLGLVETTAKRRRCGTTLLALDI
jgi:hypothetical protein